MDALADGPKTQQDLLARAKAKAERGMRLWLKYAWSAMRPAILEGLICYGPPRGAEATFVRVDQWLPEAPAGIDVADARAGLATRFLTAFGPATPRDFSKWSGLKTETRSRNRVRYAHGGPSTRSWWTAHRAGFFVAISRRWPTARSRLSILSTAAATASGVRHVSAGACGEGSPDRAALLQTCVSESGLALSGGPRVWMRCRRLVARGAGPDVHGRRPAVHRTARQTCPARASRAGSRSAGPLPRRAHCIGGNSPPSTAEDLEPSNPLNLLNPVGTHSNPQSMFVTAIIAAGGRGERFGGAQPKQLLLIGGRTILERSVTAF